MCFSATASFTASAILTAVGVGSIARNGSTAHRMFAGIPLIFAAQQASEGLVWLTITEYQNTTLQRVAVTVFFGIALVVWPLWFPVSLRLIERNAARRRVLTAICWFGGIIAASGALVLLRWRPEAVVIGHSVGYDYAGSGRIAVNVALLLAYFTPTIAPFFVSTASLARAVGAMLVVSLVAASLIQWQALTSVWCFFGAILSGLIMVAVDRERVRNVALAVAPAGS